MRLIAFLALLGLIAPVWADESCSWQGDPMRYVCKDLDDGSVTAYSEYKIVDLDTLRYWVNYSGTIRMGAVQWEKAYEVNCKQGYKKTLSVSLSGYWPPESIDIANSEVNKVVYFQDNSLPGAMCRTFKKQLEEYRAKNKEQPSL